MNPAFLADEGDREGRCRFRLRCGPIFPGPFFGQRTSKGFLSMVVGSIFFLFMDEDAAGDFDRYSY